MRNARSLVVRASAQMHPVDTRATQDAALQRKYYAATAVRYDDMRRGEEFVVGLALDLMMSVLDRLEIRSILDIGSGTGRALMHMKRLRPDIRAVGIEPVAELRAMGHKKGIPEQDLIDGDATDLSYPDGAFDLVCEYETLHHIRRPDLAVAEMLRVARKAIFICDVNNFGQGSAVGRMVKRAIDAMGLWKLANFVKTRGRGFSISEGDGLYYSYSVFNDYRQIRSACRGVYLMNNTADASYDLYKTAAGIALLGIKK